LVPLSPETAANIFPEARGTIETFETVIEGLPIEVAVSKVSVEEPALVVLLAVRRYRSPPSPKSLNADVHTLSFESSATCGRMYLSLAEEPSSTVTALSNVIVVPDIVPRRITTS
jgi:hypothetical protein